MGVTVDQSFKNHAIRVPPGYSSDIAHYDTGRSPQRGRLALLGRALLWGSTNDYGPPRVTKHIYDYDREEVSGSQVAFITGKDIVADQALKYLGNKEGTMKDREEKSEKLKEDWCRRTAVVSYPDCCGLLSAEKIISRNRLVVAPIGIPLDGFVNTLKQTKNCAKTFQYLGENANSNKFPACLDSLNINLTIARIFADLVRFIDCLHASGRFFGDVSADNFIIVCRRPEYTSKACRRLMLMAIDFEAVLQIKYETNLPHGPISPTPQQKNIMLRSMKVADTEIAGKIGHFSGRALLPLILEHKERQIHRPGETFNDWQKRHWEFQGVKNKTKDGVYVDPVLEDRYQAIGIIILCLHALEQCEDFTQPEESPNAWQDLLRIVVEYRSVAQGTEKVRGNGFSVYINPESPLSSPEKTEEYLSECVKCEALWKRLCEVIAHIIKQEKAGATAAQIGACSDADPLPSLLAENPLPRWLSSLAGLPDAERNHIATHYH